MNTEELQSAYGEPYSWFKRHRLNNSFERVVEFMRVFGHPVYDKPTVIEDEGWEKMRLGLIQEEFAELLEAAGYTESARWIRDVVLVKSGEADIVGVADALGDIEYVVNGMAAGMGINLPAVVKEIHRSNMTKLGADGKPIYREDGKILKGENYEPPNLEKVLFEE